MHNRFLAGWRGVLLATVFASLIVAPFSTVAASAKDQVTSEFGGESAGLGTVVGEEENPFTIPMYPRTNYQWPFATGPFYGGDSLALQPGTLRTPVGTFDLRSDQLGIPAELRTANVLGQVPAQYFIVAVDPAAAGESWSDALRQTIEGNGGAVIQSVPVAATVARLTNASLAAVQAMPGVVAVEPYHAAFKLHPTIGRTPLPDPFKAQSEVYDLDVMLHAGENAAATASALAEMGASVLNVFGDTVRIEIHRDRLGQVARLESVARIFEHVPVFAQGEETTVTMQWGEFCVNGSATCGDGPYHLAGVDGGGPGDANPFVLMVLDSGIQLDNGDLSDERTIAGSPGPAHRKVVEYAATNQFGGGGDLLGCDASAQGAFTHGHSVSAVALGWGTDVDAGYNGEGWTAVDPSTGVEWKLDGVAPKAKLVAYDAEVTPSLVSCNDPSQGGLSVGDIYTGPSSGSLAQAYDTYGALDSNFSWGSQNFPTYGTNATKIDNFLDSRRDAMVFTSAGNDGSDEDNDLIRDPNSVSDPATCKNCLAIGATGNGTAGDSQRSFSSIGPATANYPRVGRFGDGRLQPLLMAPGADGNGVGLAETFNCRSLDNDQNSPVECDIVTGINGTSFSSPAAAGSALLVRDYFASGFYPSGAERAADQVPTISGALLKSILVASADWVGNGNNPGGFATILHRANREQGFGRIELDNALPLESWIESPTGLVVADGDTPGGANNTTLAGQITASATQSTTVNVVDTTQELRIVLGWTEGSGEFLINDLDLEVESPTGVVYYGNYFTDDNDRNGSIGAGEDCLSLDGTSGLLDASPWSLATCANSVRDDENVVEGVFLSPDPDANGDAEDGLSQIEPGDWTVRVIAKASVSGTQNYAVAIAGGVAIGSSVRFNNGAPVCNDSIGLTVNETDDVDDPGAGLTIAEIQSRLTVQVLDAASTVVDEEAGTVLTFEQPDPAALRFVASDLVLSELTAADPGNGVLDVFDGARLRVVYADEVNGTPDPNKERVSSSTTDCSAAIGFGNLVFARFGRDTLTFVDGGCERNERGSFEYGAPDQYLDNGETVNYAIAFFNNETIDLDDAVAELRCVVPDGDSPPECLPGTDDCADPNRLNNAACAGLSILDTPKFVGDVPAGAAIAAQFTVEVTSATPQQEVEMVLGVSSPTSGKSVQGYALSRQVLEADDVEFFYSTDFPTGGTEIRDYNNSETPEITESIIDQFFLDYRIEERTWSDSQATGKNLNLNAPWNFDANDGGFTSGIGAISDPDLGVGVIVANWGEDKNFNNALDAGEDRDPANGVLDQNWGTTGGCGWQTRGGAATGGVWHTGRIGGTTGNKCLVNGATSGQCQTYEIIPGDGDNLGQFELLLTPVVEQVDTTRTMQHLNFAWNMAYELNDQFALFSWEFDTDTEAAEPVDLTADGSIFNAAGGPGGPVSAENNPGLFRPASFGPADEGYPMFAPLSGSSSSNGTVGNNRVGKNSCYFENAGIAGTTPLGFAAPPDDDLDNDTDGTTDEYVTAAGPIRNFDLTTFNGPDLRFTTLEDIYGDSGASFQGALGFFIAQDNDATATPNPTTGFGVAIDDVVMEWKEIETGPDTTDCLTGECATLNLDVTNFYEGSAILNITLTEKSPEAANDCDLDGIADGTTDCDNDGARDIPVDVYNDLRADEEIVFANETSPGSGVFVGTISISATGDVDGEPWTGPGTGSTGTLFVQRNGTDAPSVNVDYQDNDDGTGNVCNNDVDPAARGLISAGTAVLYPTGLISVVSARIEDNGDGDGIADTNETVNLFLTVQNNSGFDLTNVVARVSTNSANVDCITDNTAVIGDIPEEGVVESGEALVFKVANVSRGSAFGSEFGADFTVSLSSDEFAATFAPQELTLDFDLNITPGAGSPTEFFEGFESSGTTFGQFTVNAIDNGLSPVNNTGSNGYRCQYNDPDFQNANSFENADCYLEHPFPFGPVNAWHVHDQGDTVNAPDGGRARSGANSAHMGTHNLNPDDDTTALGQLEAIETTAPVHLDAAATSVLSFAHQISIVDDRTVNAPGGETPDRAVVMVQLADNGGNPAGDWIKIAPYRNIYDRQGTDNFFECMFDPIDDGSTEDDFFDPGDPDRRLGPSSTCFPEFVFAFHGDTDYRNSFSPTALGRATEGPGEQGSIDRGTWVTPEFNLFRFQGRSIYLRFLFTSIQVFPGVTTIEALFDLPNGWPGDDGWYIDDVRVTNARTTANTVAVDNAANTSLPNSADCGIKCTTLTASLASDSLTDSTPAPGHSIELSAAGSSADSCVDGVLQYAFWIDGNDNGVVGDAGDTLLRDFTDDPIYVAAPTTAGQVVYGVDVRCSSEPTCGELTNDATLPITVNCPSSGNLGGGPFGEDLVADTKTQYSWNTQQSVDVIQGSLDTLRSGGSFTGSVNTCIADSQTLSSFTDGTTPALGSGLYYLVRGGAAGGGDACNAGTPSYSTGSASETGDRDGQIGADGNACP